MLVFEYWKFSLVRSSRKRPYSSSRHSGSGLEPVPEENPWQHHDPNFNLARLSENGPTPENGEQALSPCPSFQLQAIVFNQFSSEVFHRDLPKEKEY